MFEGKGRNAPAKILCRHLILCEGEDEKQFLIAYLNSKERKAEDIRFGEAVQVENFGGNEELKRGLAVTRRTPGFADLRTLLIIRDAERDAYIAEKEILTALRTEEYAVPTEMGAWSQNGLPYTAYLLFPSLGKELENGTLEDLCMELIREEYRPKQVMPRIAAFMNDLKDDGMRTYQHDFKSKIHSFFSVTDPFVGLKIGESARAGAFDWNSKRLSRLNSCLMEGFNRD